MSFSTLTLLALSFLPSTLAATGTFSTLTLNVAGLPSWINDNGVPGDKADAATMIGQKFAQYNYDIIQIQEDFHYHDEIYAADNHPFRTKTSGDVPFGSGLNTLSNYNWTTLERITWDECFIADGDCLTPKGFTFMRLQLAEGVEVDFYNLHADAGQEDGDQEARRENLRQVVERVRSVSAGRSVVVEGDTNSLYSRTTDDVGVFGQVGLGDAWVERVYGGVIPTNVPKCPGPTTDNTCEVYDKILYRSGDSVKLNATSFDYVTDMFLQPDGSILTDHNAVLAEFSWSSV
ncbi:hypothetical protein M409DRAFT_67873 [Zasmidium cellare ATCC 36951]|uniref:Inositol polyphosphate-related phosphatase domain-containing protein n=1 Tax=Zasmidium cellare ATCC 36951 TaxID=1080233 RepID=A0A6A6CFZ8_ZASCE|nr:uncharacterized protein M409DRAFT_67873 [Zasmidium cellare ATCC 36951]KAF2164336.1 hypothetical protein M409DRAFT_67873 [Zasmidium cellare ATCC 36951]